MLTYARESVSKTATNFFPAKDGYIDEWGKVLKKYIQSSTFI
jgi:hypothetical protein